MCESLINTLLARVFDPLNDPERILKNTACDISNSRNTNILELLHLSRSMDSLCGYLTIINLFLDRLFLLLHLFFYSFMTEVWILSSAEIISEIKFVRHIGLTFSSVEITLDFQIK